MTVRQFYPRVLADSMLKIHDHQGIQSRVQQVDVLRQGHGPQFERHLQEPLQVVFDFDNAMIGGQAGQCFRGKAEGLIVHILRYFNVEDFQLIFQETRTAFGAADFAAGCFWNVPRFYQGQGVNRQVMFIGHSGAHGVDDRSRKPFVTGEMTVYFVNKDEAFVAPKPVGAL